MALPALAKVSRFQVNNTVAGNATVLTQNRNLLFALHTAIIGGGSWTDKENAALAATNPATVVASCDSATVSMVGVNKWVAAANIVWASSGARSWIVYYFTAAGVYLMIECFDGGVNTHNLVAKVSHTDFSAAAGGTDGTTTASPTALNSITLLSSATWGGHTTGSNASVLHVIAAQDGTAFNAVICRNSFAVASLHFGKPINARTGWTNPYSCNWTGRSDSAAEAVAFSTACSASSGWVGIANAGTSIVIVPATTGYTSQLFPSLFTGSDPFSTDYPIFEIILASPTGGSNSSYLGLPADKWFGTTGHSTGSGYPGAVVDAAKPRQFMKFGPYVFPWNNSAVVIA